jgi:hypothetical protein
VDEDIFVFKTHQATRAFVEFYSAGVLTHDRRIKEFFSSEIEISTWTDSHRANLHRKKIKGFFVDFYAAKIELLSSASVSNLIEHMLQLSVITSRINLKNQLHQKYFVVSFPPPPYCVCMSLSIYVFVFLTCIFCSPVIQSAFPVCLYFVFVFLSMYITIFCYIPVIPFLRCFTMYIHTYIHVLILFILFTFRNM